MDLIYIQDFSLVFNRHCPVMLPHPPTRDIQKALKFDKLNDI